MKKLLLLSAALGACSTTPLVPGDVGTARLVGEIRGAAPMQLLPPITDRAGNVYVLNGAPDLPQTNVYVGLAGGGWSEGCSATKGNTDGIRYWAGVAQDRAWYWSGDALVEVSGKTGACTHVLDKDPSSNGDLRFISVIPWVDETPSRIHLMGLVLSPADSTPFLGVIDLGAKTFVSLRAFEVSSPTIYGAGGDAPNERGVIVLSGDDGTPEAHWIDRDGNTSKVTTLGGGEHVTGPIAIGSDGTAAAVGDSGLVLVFDENGGGMYLPELHAAGVHAWNGALWIVGLDDDGKPMIAQIVKTATAGEFTFDAPVAWDASTRTATVIDAGMDVLDDHTMPRAWLQWTTTTNAIGTQPFVSPWKPDDHGSGVAGWLVAGPSYQVGGTSYTRVAYIPVGIDYPMIGVLAATAISLTGWVQPQFGLTYAPEALPRDQYSYGVGQSRAGLMVFGEPIDNFHYFIHLTVGGDTLDHPIGIEQATASWEPKEWLSLTVGRMRVPYSAEAFALQTQLMFPTRSGPNDVFLPGTDLGVLATTHVSSIGLVASAGIWNGTGQEAGVGVPTDRGFLYSGRVDWTLGGDFPFDEGDLGRGPFRLGVGMAVLYRHSLAFDMNGFPSTENDDLHLSASFRVAFRGFYLQAEGLRRQQSDNLSSVTRGATGAYAQTSFYFVVGGVGLSPLARAGWARQDENFNPTEIDYVDGGFAIYPHGESDHPDSLRLEVVYQGEWHTTENEEAHKVAFWMQLLF